MVDIFRSLDLHSLHRLLLVRKHHKKTEKNITKKLKNKGRKLLEKKNENVTTLMGQWGGNEPMRIPAQTKETFKMKDINKEVT